MGIRILKSCLSPGPFPPAFVDAIRVTDTIAGNLAPAIKPTRPKDFFLV